METNSSRSSSPPHHRTHTDQRLTFCLFPCFRKHIKTHSSSSCSEIKSGIIINITVLILTTFSTTHLLYRGLTFQAFTNTYLRQSQLGSLEATHLPPHISQGTSLLVSGYPPHSILRTPRRLRWGITNPYQIQRPLIIYNHHVPT